MSANLVIAVPSKGRLQENAEAFFARAGLNLVKPRGAREYRGTIAGLDNVEVAYLSAADITTQLATGAAHPFLHGFRPRRRLLHRHGIRIAPAQRGGGRGPAGGGRTL
jgi:hypothetical protein